VDQAQPPRRHLEELSAAPDRPAAAWPHPIIAREGWPFLAASGALAAAVTAFAGWGWAAPFWLATLFVLQFFRDPARAVPADPRAVLSPADGRIVAVEKARDPYLEREALKISVFMNVFNVHSNRSPVDGTVRRRWYHAGSFLNAALDKASLENERNALWLRTPDGSDITCVQIAGLVARRILCYVDEGAGLARGERYGFIRFGSRVDVYLPPDAAAVAALGDRVHAAESILARLAPRG
jgi:phosphatidylserine decarboxylase